MGRRLCARETPAKSLPDDSRLCRADWSALQPALREVRHSTLDENLMFANDRTSKRSAHTQPSTVYAPHGAARISAIVGTAIFAPESFAINRQTMIDLQKANRGLGAQRRFDAFEMVRTRSARVRYFKSRRSTSRSFSASSRWQEH